MTKNARTVWVVAVIAVFLIVAGVIVFDFAARIWQREHYCDDGPRLIVDIRDFTTKYSAYSLDFEATVADKLKLQGKVVPVQLQQLSDSLQSANEFRKYLVAGYNGCAITKAQYAAYGAVFQEIDSVSRQITSLTSKPALSQDEKNQVQTLVSRYVELTSKLSPQ